MRLLLFSDVHRNQEAARNLVKMAGEADVAVGAGDFATMREGIHDVIDILAEIDRPTVLVPGNSESYDELAAACSDWPMANVLQGSGRRIEGVDFWGVGGAIPVTPFGSWSYDFSEDDARRMLARCPPGAVIVSHSPPRGAVDRSSRGQNLGSAALLEAIAERRPRLVVCGHIHESAGSAETVAGTTVINAGPQGMYWDLPVSV